ncbi:PREDICTED: uncharacterized protein LOC104585814 [Nelumbo nucifera]|uniref:Uncharacterized protein LOC104585814 n=2 Tax=Nelumbo nucifera TaxID=4432 RepID=A0A1U7Z1S4_NELNU|nr:PREDICTED: uncharacterized protein LOC104585814 [Nelumbo nucifera]DAD23902.1 TPA_asm: hypothetical protein HUJ06_025365 [Nelumbo nucifera]
MALRLRRLREISRAMPRYLSSGITCLHSRQDTILPSPSFIHLRNMCMKINKSLIDKGCHSHRLSTLSDSLHESSSESVLLTFMESTLDELEGPYHCWLNKLEESKELFDRNGIFLVLSGAFLDRCSMLSSDHVVMLERVKFLQQRYRQLNVFGFQPVSAVGSIASHTCLIWTTLKEYITFPILLSSKNFPEIKNGACYLLFKAFKGPLICHEKSADVGTIIKDIEELNLLHSGDSLTVQKFQGTGVKQSEFIKEPYICSFLQNLLLYFPGCISVDETRNRLFLSDTNHHRIIVSDGNGMILDCIGSSPGFEDGEFEIAKLFRPASSFYYQAEDCLYFVDSENHAIRKANFDTRTVETFFPTIGTSRKIFGMWGWILDKLGMGREAAEKSQELGLESLIFPWHLMKSRDNDLLIVNRRFETLWVMNLASGEIKEIAKGFSNIMEICGQTIMEKESILKEIGANWLEQSVNTSMECLSFASLMSSIATFEHYIIFCDAVGHRVLKLDRESGVVSELQLSNFGMLGLPYWLDFPLERVFVGGNAYQRPCIDHLQCFNVLPGRCDIQVTVDIPEGTELAAPLEEVCIWRQARGSAAEVSGSNGVSISSEKVGVAQQWFDELDNLAFSEPGSESNIQEETDSSDRNFQDEKVVHIDSAVNISPGTSEVIIYAVLYLKLSRAWMSAGVNQENKAQRLLDILNYDRSGKKGRDSSIQLMLKLDRDLGDVTFMRPLHLRIRLECRDHPVPDRSKEVILTDSSLEVKVSLD